MAIIVPDSASTFSAPGVVGNIDLTNQTIAGHWVWLGLSPSPGGASACVVWMDGTASTTASPILPIVISTGGNTVMYGPLKPRVGLVVAMLSGGCAILGFKSACY